MHMMNKNDNKIVLMYKFNIKMKLLMIDNLIIKKVVIKFKSLKEYLYKIVTDNKLNKQIINKI